MKEVYSVYLAFYCASRMGQEKTAAANLGVENLAAAAMGANDGKASRAPQSAREVAVGLKEMLAIAE